MRHQTVAAFILFWLMEVTSSVLGAPNVLFIVTDDQRPDTIHALGNEHIETPNLDELVRSGTTFTRAITAVPICVASRIEILTGRNCRDNGRNNFGYSPVPGVPHLAKTMSEAGYQTCYVGKWHTVGRPSASGYQQTFGLFGSGGGKYPLTFPTDWKGMDVTGYRGWVFQTDDRKLFPEQGVGLTPNISEKFADAAIEFLEQRNDNPFLLHVNFTAPHDPLFMPRGREGEYTRADIPLPPNFRPEHPFDHGNAGGRDEVLFHSPRTEEETKRGLAVYYAVIKHLDQQVGRVMDYLKKHDLDDDTIVIYTSDHGLAMGSHGLRGKQNMYEHSIGVPLIVAGPGIGKNEKTNAQCYLRDIYPTICDYGSAAIPKTVQGKSLKPVLDGEVDSIYDEVIGSFQDSQWMIRTERWKYVRYPLVDREQLFDLKNDPYELHNLVTEEEHAKTLRDLRQRLAKQAQLPLGI